MEGGEKKQKKVLQGKKFKNKTFVQGQKQILIPIPAYCEVWTGTIQFSIMGVNI